MTTDFNNQELLGDVAGEACKDLDPKLRAAGERLLTALGTEKEVFFQYEELEMQAMVAVQVAVQRLTVERMLAAGFRQVIFKQ